MNYSAYQDYIRAIPSSGQSVWSRISSILEGREYNLDEINYLLQYMNEVQQDPNLSSREKGKIEIFTPQLTALLPSKSSLPNNPTPDTPELPTSIVGYAGGRGYEMPTGLSIGIVAVGLALLYLAGRKRGR